MRSSSTNSLLNGCYVCFKYSVVISCRARRELGGGKRLKEITKKKQPTHIIIRRVNISGGIIQARASAEDSINISADSTHL